MSDRVVVDGPIVVGAGPSGLAVAACLKARGIPSLVVERANCVASLWQQQSYDRLRLHLPKHFCELPLMPFPSNFPTYPTKHQFIEYLENYAKHFDIRPVFNTAVISAVHDPEAGIWKVKTKEKEYESRWLVVATGENAEAIVPEIDGSDYFKGPVVHTSLYKNGEALRGKRVLVVGCGNSGMEVCWDLCNHGAQPSISIRDKVHVLPREIFGWSTFGLSMWLLRWLPVRVVDRLLLLLAQVMIGDTARYGLNRPSIGPLELKSVTGKTPVLDVGTLKNIKSGEIKVFPALKRLGKEEVEFVDGQKEKFDAIILATGYKSNVPSWLKDEREFCLERDGMPRRSFPNSWKGKRGLYAVGFTRRGLFGAAIDAKMIAHDMEECLKSKEVIT